MNIKSILMILGWALSLGAMAGEMGSATIYRPWSVIGGLGYAWYDFGYHGFSR